MNRDFDSTYEPRAIFGTRCGNCSAVFYDWFDYAEHCRTRHGASLHRPSGVACVEFGSFCKPEDVRKAVDAAVAYLHREDTDGDGMEGR